MCQSLCFPQSHNSVEKGRRQQSSICGNFLCMREPLWQLNAAGSQLPTELLFSVKGIVLCAQTWRDGTVLDAT